MGRTSDARERLVVGAAELIYAHSYQGVSVDELCDRAGVHKGSFYYFFPSKRDLAVAAVDSQWLLARGALVEPAFAEDVPPLQRIARFFAFLAEATAEDKRTFGRVGGCRFGNLVAETAVQVPEVAGRVRDVFTSLLEFFEQALEAAVEQGELGPVEIHQTALALLAYMEGILLVGRSFDDEAVVRELAGRAVPLVLGGIAASPDQP